MSYRFVVLQSRDVPTIELRAPVACAQLRTLGEVGIKRVRKWQQRSPRSAESASLSLLLVHVRYMQRRFTIVELRGGQREREREGVKEPEA